MRKLTFDETPDYDFLRDLFLTALKNNGDEDDGTYDWMLLNNGKGWETNGVSSLIMTDEATDSFRLLLLLMLHGGIRGHGRRRSTKIGWTGCAAVQ